MGQEQLTFFPTYGYTDGDRWLIPVRLRLCRERPFLDRLLADIAGELVRPSPRELNNFRDRIAGLIADDLEGRMVELTFEGNGNRHVCQLRHGEDLLLTDFDGVVEDVVELPRSIAASIAPGTGRSINCQAVSGDTATNGRIQLIEPSGSSLISDIDDTIKITEIPAGLKIVTRNTFFRDFVAVPQMSQRYHQLGVTAFHYVSGSPWQLYRPLGVFLIAGGGGFPEGSFHLKTVDHALRSNHTWQELAELAAEGFDSKTATYNQKVKQIREIIGHFPGRRFILFGDSGEKDPEVYREIRAEFGDRIKSVHIRDVVNARELDPARLDFVDEKIPAQTIEPGVSQFGSI